MKRCKSPPQFEGLRQEPFSLPPMPQGSYAEVIKGPGLRLEGTARALTIDDALVDALLGDIEAGGAKDALPLLSFTLERLSRRIPRRGPAEVLSTTRCSVALKARSEAAVERAMKAADADPNVPQDRASAACAPAPPRFDPLARRYRSGHRRAAPALPHVFRRFRRSRGRWSDHLVEQRLLATDLVARLWRDDDRAGA